MTNRPAWNIQRNDPKSITVSLLEQLQRPSVRKHHLHKKLNLMSVQKGSPEDFDSFCRAEKNPVTLSWNILFASATLNSVWKKKQKAAHSYLIRLVKTKPAEQQLEG